MERYSYREPVVKFKLDPRFSRVTDALAQARRACLLLVVATVCAVSASARAQTAAPVRDADAVCGKCHEAVLKSYLQTPMANASGLASERFVPGSLSHAASGVTYTIAMQQGEAWLNYRLPGSPAAGTEQLQYFLGSGHLGITYLYAKDQFWFESPVAYYRSLDGYAMKPGLENTPEMPPALAIGPSCLRCHMSAVQPQQSGTENHYPGLPFRNTGITCEACHGDTAAHVASGGHAPVVNPAKLSPIRRDSTCIVCHLEGDTSVERKGRSASEFQPGDDIRDILSYFTFAGAKTTARAVSEIEQFSSSRCKLVTGPSMSCMNCHNPHASPTSADRVSYYRSKCLACHVQETYRSAHFPAQPDCTSCHMPKTGSQNIAHVAWTDHRIRQHPQPAEAAGPPDASFSVNLLPVLASDNEPRDLALAYYNLAVKGIKSQQQRATSQVASALQKDPDDIALLRAMGILSEMNGNLDAAKQDYLALLKQDPMNLTANNNLGTILARSGDLEGAIRTWDRVFQANEDLPQLAGNLALAECRLGRADAARTTLQILLRYNPDSRQVRHRFRLEEGASDPCPQAPETRKTPQTGLGPVH